jgi:cobyric acid synthase
MATAALDEKRPRGIVKAALVDAFKENRDLMQDIIYEMDARAEIIRVMRIQPIQLIKPIERFCLSLATIKTI